MKIGIDYSLATATNRGMGRYVREIVNCLIKDDRENHYILYTHKPIDFKLPSNFTEHRINSSNEIIAEQWSLPHMAKHDSIDVLWCPTNTFPLFLSKKIKLVVTIHDLIFMYPSLGKATSRQRIGRIYRRWVLKLGKRRIDRALTVSKYSSTEIERILGLKNTSVTYNCIDSFYKLSESIKAPEHRDDFYFTVSGDAPSKNLSFLIDTFEDMLPNAQLVIAGLPASSPLRERQSEQIYFLKANVSDEELISNYKLCKGFIFVSLCEGFGIPILEALVCDTPIVSSNTTSLPEVVAQFGQLIDPTDKKQLVEAIKKLDKQTDNIESKTQHLEQFLKWSNSAEIVKKELVR